MIKEIYIKYSEANEKYDLIIDDEFVGKHYNLTEALAHIERIHDRNRGE